MSRSTQQLIREPKTKQTNKTKQTPKHPNIRIQQANKPTNEQTLKQTNKKHVSLGSVHNYLGGGDGLVEIFGTKFF